MKTIIMMMIITAGPGHVDVRGHHDCKVGGLGSHWVGVDLAHVVACVLNGYLVKQYVVYIYVIYCISYCPDLLLIKK